VLEIAARHFRNCCASFLNFLRIKKNFLRTISGIGAQETGHSPKRPRDPIFPVFPADFQMNQFSER
jgi:hypothetical protein